MFDVLVALVACDSVYVYECTSQSTCVQLLVECAKVCVWSGRSPLSLLTFNVYALVMMCDVVSSWQASRPDWCGWAIPVISRCIYLCIVQCWQWQMGRPTTGHTDMCVVVTGVHVGFRSS